MKVGEIWKYIGKGDYSVLTKSSFYSFG